MRWTILFVGALGGILGSACGGQVVESTTDAKTASAPEQPAQAQGGDGKVTSDVPDVPADSSDPCSIAQPGEAKALPAGVTLPVSSPGLRLDFELTSQTVVLTRIRERGVAPAWTSEDTQIFDPATTSGDWVESRDAAGALTFQRNMYDPLARTIEAVPDPNDPNSHWSNTEVCSATADFSVEIPGDAAEVRIYGQELSARPTKLLAWYRLR